MIISLSTPTHPLSLLLSCLSALLQSVKQLERHANNLVNGEQSLRQAVRRGYLLTSRLFDAGSHPPCAA